VRAGRRTRRLREPSDEILFLICSSDRLVLETAFSDRTMALLRSGFSVAVT
jgi:hypothetical protein